MKEINFERKFFIKNLYNPKFVISSFDIVEFESFGVFRELVENSLYHFVKNTLVVIPIETEIEYKAILQVFEVTKANDVATIILYIKNSNILDFVMKNLKDLKFQIMIDFEIPCMLFSYWRKGEPSEKWISNNRFYKRIKISYPEYEKQINRIINTCGAENIRFFWTDIDYESFNDMKFGEMKDLAFSLNHLKEYTIGKQQPIVLNYKTQRLLKRIFVANDWKLYLNNLKDDIWCFDLKEHLEDDGCSMDKVEINKLRMYIDLKPEVMNPYFIKVYDWFYIDFYYNLKLEKTFNHIPLISSVFDRWMTHYGYPIG